jgi:Holliday junction resolvasome RuvABC endonuclease subunit
MTGGRRPALVLVIYFNTRGFAFVLFEGHQSPFDWGLFETRGPRKQRRCLARVVKILDRYQPDFLVLRDSSTQDTRTQRIANLNAAISELAKDRRIPIHAYSHDHVRDAFEYAGVGNKQGVAEVIAKHIPAFERYVPPPRKPWMSEDPRMGLFDAAALGLSVPTHPDQLFRLIPISRSD